MSSSDSLRFRAADRRAPALAVSLVLALGSVQAADVPPSPVVAPTGKTIMGWLEGVVIKPWGIKATAKLDTGAKTSSVHASRIEHFSREGKQWVRFHFSSGDDKESTLIERPLVRTAVIKERQSKSSTRDVVTLTLCKNGKDYETEFTLNDRSNFNYPILLGRSFLEEVVLVDSAETFLFKVDTDPCVARPATGQPASRSH